MCKYCEKKEDEYFGFPIYFLKKGMFISKEKQDKKVSVITNLKEDINGFVLNKGWVIMIKGPNEKDVTDWYDLKINYCPICGKQLRENPILDIEQLEKEAYIEDLKTKKIFKNEIDIALPECCKDVFEKGLNVLKDVR